MEDRDIVQLYWDRDERAIPATSEKYGSYCRSIARNILRSREDAEECVNDTWLHAWNAMPPHRPDPLSVFLGKLTRNLSFNRWRHDRAEKRGGGEMALVLDELGEVVSGTDTPEAELNRKELLAAIDGFLGGLSQPKRELFVRRYWYAQSVAAIAKKQGMTAGAVSTALSRVRRDLNIYLEERGFDL